MNMSLVGKSLPISQVQRKTGAEGKCHVGQPKGLCDKKMSRGFKKNVMVNSVMLWLVSQGVLLLSVCKPNIHIHIYTNK